MYEVQGLPVFVKAGAIIPTQADVDRLRDDPPGELWLDVYPDAESTFVLNDGLDLATRITCRQSPGKAEVAIAMRCRGGSTIAACIVCRRTPRCWCGSNCWKERTPTGRVGVR